MCATLPVTEDHVEYKKLEPWQHVAECAWCHDKIFSKYQGEFTTCKCGKISVDSTRFYTRFIGNPGDFVDNDSSESE